MFTKLSVILYDLLLRVFSYPSHYIVFTKSYNDADDYLMSDKVKKSARLYINKAANIDNTPTTCILKRYLSEKVEIDFCKKIFLEKHSSNYFIYLLWKFFVLNFINYHKNSIISVYYINSEIIAVFVEFSTPKMHYFLSAFVDHELSKQSGIYLSKYKEMIEYCIKNKIQILRLGPKVDSLKSGLGAIPLDFYYSNIIKLLG